MASYNGTHYCQLPIPIFWTPKSIYNLYIPVMIYTESDPQLSPLSCALQPIHNNTIPTVWSQYI